MLLVRTGEGRVSYQIHTTMQFLPSDQLLTNYCPHDLIVVIVKSIMTNKSTSTTLKISLPKELSITAKKRAEAQHYATVSGYIQHLIRQDDEFRSELDQTKSLLDEGLKSGLSKMTAHELIDELGSDLKAKTKKPQNKQSTA